MANKYIQNVHTNSIKPHTADKKEYIFRPQSVDHFSGRQTSTGYTRLTQDEYGALLAESALFRHFIKLKKLIVHDELPADAQTPHEALVSARKDVGKLSAELDKVNEEKAALQAEIDGLDKKYKELLAASGSDQLVKAEAALKDAQEKVQALATEKEAVEKDFTGMKKEFEALKAEHDKLLKKGK
jgi:chromosome segregation ATPase